MISSEIHSRKRFSAGHEIRPSQIAWKSSTIVLYKVVCVRFGLQKREPHKKKKKKVAMCGTIVSSEVTK